MEREREKEREGERDEGKSGKRERGGSWPRDRRPIHRAAAPRPAFRDIKGRHGSTCIGARRDVGVVDIRAVNLASTRCPRKILCNSRDFRLNGNSPQYPLNRMKEMGEQESKNLK